MALVSVAIHEIVDCVVVDVLHVVVDVVVVEMELVLDVVWV